MPAETAGEYHDDEQSGENEREEQRVRSNGMAGEAQIGMRDMPKRKRGEHRSAQKDHAQENSADDPLHRPNMLNGRGARKGDARIGETCPGSLLRRQAARGIAKSRGQRLKNPTMSSRITAPMTA